jgi:hypothetical protein
LAEHLPALRPAERRGLGLWVLGTILAGSACQTAVLAAVEPRGGRWHARRQQLREWTYEGRERAAPCGTTLDVAGCFVWLLRWVVSWWRSDTLPLAIDVTSLGTRWVVIAVCVLSRGGAIPVAWHVKPGPGRGEWMPPRLEVLERLAPAVPPTLTVLVLTDRGRWSPRWWRRIKDIGWHPLMRVRPDATFAPLGGPRRPARTLVPGPGHAGVGAGTACTHRDVRRPGTLVVVWDEGEAAPWLVLTDLAPPEVGVVWYGLRVWVELGFRALKRLGWQWERIRRTAPERVARHWLVLAVATLLDEAYGTRVEDADLVGVPPARLRTPPSVPVDPTRRQTSVFARGLAWLRAGRGRRGPLWTRLWLRPQPLPSPPPDLVITYHQSPLPEVAA